MKATIIHRDAIHNSHPGVYDMLKRNGHSYIVREVKDGSKHADGMLFAHSNNLSELTDWIETHNLDFIETVWTPPKKSTGKTATKSAEDGSTP